MVTLTVSASVEHSLNWLVHEKKSVQRLWETFFISIIVFFLMPTDLDLKLQSCVEFYTPEKSTVEEFVFKSSFILRWLKKKNLNLFFLCQFDSDGVIGDSCGPIIFHLIIRRSIQEVSIFLDRGISLHSCWVPLRAIKHEKTIVSIVLILTN